MTSGQILEKLENIMINSKYTNCTLNSEKFPFLNQIPFFS
jgi:hypothetical protein